MEALRQTDSSLLREFVRYYDKNAKQEWEELEELVDNIAYPLKRFIGTIIKKYDINAFYGAFCLLSFLRYSENSKMAESRWLNISLAFLKEEFCQEEAAILAADTDEYLSGSIDLVSECYPQMLFYFQPFFLMFGQNFVIDLFAVLELLRRSLNNDLNNSNSYLKH